MRDSFRFQDLECWKHARKLACFIYNVSKNERLNNDSWLASEIQSAALTVMSTIAEGAAWNSDIEFAGFLEFSRSALVELQNYVFIALDLGYIKEKQFREFLNQANSTAVIINELIKYLRDKSDKRADQIEKSESEKERERTLN